MAAAGNVRIDNSLLSRIDQRLFKLESLLNLLAGLITLFVMFVAVANIVGRYFGYPVPGYIDYMEQAVPAIAILGIAYCQRIGGHIRMDIVVGALKGRVLWFAEFLGVLFMLLITSVLIYGSWDHAFRFAEGTQDPVAVPLIEDVAEQTKREAETVSGLEGEGGK